MTSCCKNECNLACFYTGSQQIDPLLIKKYTFQGMEIYALLKSLNLTLPLLSGICQKYCGNNPCPPCGPCDPCPPCEQDCNTVEVEQVPIASKLVIDANQMLAIGYSHIKLGFPLIFSIFPGVEVVVRNGGKIVIFNDNSLINYGNIYFDNSTLILESDDTARLINNGCITLKSSFMIGKGIIFNNGRFNAICYSKVVIGRNKASNLEGGNNTSSNSVGQTSELDDVSMGAQKALTTLDFLEAYSRIINAGSFEVNSYSTFELEGSFINGKNEVACCFFDQLCNLLPSDISYDPSTVCPSQAVFKLSGNSKLTFIFGNNVETEFLNDTRSNICFDGDTQSMIRRINISASKNTIVNKGNFTLNGETTFKGVNLENFYIFQSTYRVDSCMESGYLFYYGRILFTAAGFITKICNICKEACIRIAPTCYFCIDGYNLINYGKIIVGQRINASINVDATSFTAITGDNCIEISASDVFAAANLSLNATFIYGYLTLNTNQNSIIFKNFSDIIIAPKSIYMVGKNSSQNSSGRPQVSMLNQGTIFNFGLLQINRNTEIINRPCPFNINNEEFSIYNGGYSPFNTNSVIVIRKPNNGNSSGGFIKSVSASLYNGGKIRNTANGLIISWVGYQKTADENDESTVQCSLIYGLQSTVSGSGKLRITPYPNINTWDRDCLQQYLQQQGANNTIEYAF